MKWLNRSLVMFIIGIICILIPVLLAIYLSVKQSINEANNLLLSFADDVMYTADKTGEQVNSAISLLKAESKQDPCSANAINKMRILDVTSSNIQAIGYIKNNKLLCSSLSTQQLDWNLGPVDLVTSAGVLVRYNVKLPHNENSFIVVEKDHYAVIIHKGLLLETALFNKDISLGIFSLDFPQLYATKGYIDTKWFKQLGNKYEATFLQDGYAVTLLKSKKFKIGTVAAKPFSYLNQNTVKTALILIPVGVLGGVILSYILIYWMRQHISPVAILKAGIKNKEFYLLYQPVFDIRTNSCVGAEALLRWRRGTGELIFPDEFIPLAEKNGLIREVTALVFELIAKDAENLFKKYPKFHLAVNLSADDLNSSDIITNLKNLMLITGAGPGNLILEVTERKIMNLDILKKGLHAIHSLGIKVAIDDFGTGYCNFSYLETLEIDYLKIDKFFVNGIGTGSSTGQVILHIIEMAKALNLQIIAEGVENKEQEQFILDKGVPFAQGWLYSKAISLTDVLKINGEGC